MKKMYSYLLLVFISIFFVITLKAQTQIPDSLKGANPFTAGHYMPGVWDIRDYATSPPGFYVLDYNIYLSGSKFFNQDGNQVMEITGPLGTTSLDLDVNGYINVPFLFYASPLKILGGTYLAGISLPYSTVSSELAYDRIASIFTDTINQTGNVNGNVNGFSDLSVSPFGLSWGSPQFNLTTLYTFYAPTGRYTPGGSDNIGLGYWTNQFQAIGYVYPMKIKGKPSQAMAIMAALTLELNGKIKDVNVTPGNRFTVEYGISQYLSERFEIGLMGGNNFQITNDNGSAVWWNASELDRMGYIGFQAGGWPIVNQLYVAAKYNVDYGLRQRIKQHMLEVNFIYVTGWLTGM